jgi:hypothetical protein
MVLEKRKSFMQKSGTRRSLCRLRLRVLHAVLDVVTQHTTACCSMQVIDITLMKYQFTNITSLRVVQQKHSGLYSSTKYYKL